MHRDKEFARPSDAFALKYADWMRVTKPSPQETVDMAKLKILQTTAFQCQMGITDPRAEVKRLLTFLYYHIMSEIERDDR